MWAQKHERNQEQEQDGHVSGPHELGSFSTKTGARPGRWTASFPYGPLPAAPARRSSIWQMGYPSAYSVRSHQLNLEIQPVASGIDQRQHRQLLYVRCLNRYDDLDGACHKVILEYFRVFQTSACASGQSLDVETFVTQMMHEQISVNQEFSGREVVLRQWRARTGSFRNRQLQCITAIVKADPKDSSRVIVKCHTQTSGVITRETLVHGFPRVLTQRAIVAQLVGKTLLGDKYYTFELDVPTMQITRCNIEMNYAAAYAKLLRDQRDVNVLFSTLPASRPAVTNQQPIQSTPPLPPQPMPSPHSQPPTSMHLQQPQLSLSARRQPSRPPPACTNQQTQNHRRSVRQETKRTVAVAKAPVNPNRPKFVWRKRDHQDSRLYNLKLDINDLKLEIQQLKQQKQFILDENEILDKSEASSSPDRVATV